MEPVSQKICRMISRPGPFVIEDHHLRGTTELISEIYPHPVLGRTFLPGFSKYLDTCLITMDIPAFQKFFFHQLIQRFQISVRTVYDSVCHDLCGKIKIISGEFPFLTRQRHSVYIFGIHDTGNKGRGCHTSADQGRLFFQTLHGIAGWTVWQRPAPVQVRMRDLLCQSAGPVSHCG